MMHWNSIRSGKSRSEIPSIVIHLISYFSTILCKDGITIESPKCPILHLFPFTLGHEYVWVRQKHTVFYNLLRCAPFLTVLFLSRKGQNFAYTESRILIALLLKKFRFELEPNQRIEHKAKVTLFAKYGIRMRVRRRER
jgi:hypothetical protein